jgi:hypothetical protein
MQVADLRNHVRDKKQRDSQYIQVYSIVLQTRKKYFQNRAALHKKWGGRRKHVQSKQSSRNKFTGI